MYILLFDAHGRPRFWYVLPLAARFLNGAVLESAQGMGGSSVAHDDASWTVCRHESATTFLTRVIDRRSEVVQLHSPAHAACLRMHRSARSCGLDSEGIEYRAHNSESPALVTAHVTDACPGRLETERSIDANWAGVRFFVIAVALVLSVASCNSDRLRRPQPTAFALCNCLTLPMQRQLRNMRFGAACDLCGVALANLSRTNNAWRRRIGSRPRRRPHFLVAFISMLAICGVRVSHATLPTGCTAVAGTLTTCAAFSGGTTLDLSAQSLKAIQSGAFAGLSSLTTLCDVPGAICCVLLLLLLCVVVVLRYEDALPCVLTRRSLTILSSVLKSNLSVT